MSRFKPRLLAVTTRAEAEAELGRIGVDPAGIGMMAPKMLTRCVHLADLKCGQANILKQEMLALGGDAAVARGTVACSIDSTHVILMGTEKQFANLCRKLPPQPFGLSRLADELKRLLGSLNDLPRHWRTSKRELPLQRPLVMGILNTTPDSFSDGDLFSDPERAIARGIEMADEGADIIDIGGESTRPGAAPVDVAEEVRRTVPVIATLAEKTGCALSIDTWKAAVAREAIAAGAEIINDISGFTMDPAMAGLAAETGAGAVLMHTRGTPQTMQSQIHYRDLIGEVMDELRVSVERALAAGVTEDRVVIDPGIGFAKQREQNLELLRRLGEFRSLGFPILVGPSRKSFIGWVLDRDTGGRTFGTAASVTLAIANGASIVRVHDVRAMADAARMTHAICAGRDADTARSPQH